MEKIFKLIITYFFYMFFLILDFLGAFYILWAILTKEPLDLIPSQQTVLNEHQTKQGA